MKTAIKMFAVALVVVLVTNIAARSDEDTAKRVAKRAVEILQENGYTLSDAAKGVLDQGEDKVFSTTLNAGNAYIVCVAGDQNAKRIVLVVVDEEKNLVGKDDTAQGKSPNVAVTEVKPAATGTFMIGMRMVETGGTPSNFYVIIAYKGE